MDVWIKRSSRLGKCAYCPNMIGKGEFMVVGRTWRTVASGRWMKDLHWHTTCWIEQGTAAIVEKERTNPRVETRGRPKIAATSEQAVLRHKIAMRRGSLLQRIRLEMGKDSPSFDKIAHMGDRIERCKVQMEKLGGCPKDW